MSRYWVGLGVVAVVAACWAGLSSAPVFAEDFEAGDLSSWTKTDKDGNKVISVSDDPEAAHSGKHGLLAQVPKAAAEIYVDQEAAPAKDSYTRFYCKLDTAFDLGVDERLHLAQGYSADWKIVCWTVYVVNHEGALRLNVIYEDSAGNWKASPGWGEGNQGPTITKGKWYCVEMRYVASTAATGGVELFLNGEKQGSTMDNDMTPFTHVKLGFGKTGKAPGAGGKIYYDDVILGAPAYIGPLKEKAE